MSENDREPQGEGRRPSLSDWFEKPFFEKVWQAQVWTGTREDQFVTLYGETHKTLKSNVADWLRKNKPARFWNARASEENSAYHCYAYSDGSNLPYPGCIEGTLDEGWFHRVGDFEHAVDYPDRLVSLESAIHDFVNHALVVRRGPDYEHLSPFFDQPFRVRDARTVRRETDEQRLNEMLYRGWRILAIEYEAEVLPGDRVGGKKAVFVLGHREEDAI